MLTNQQIAQYRDEGFIVPDFRLSGDLLLEMREAYDELLASNPDVSPDFILGPHLIRPGAQGVRGSEKWLKFATHPEVLDMAAQLIGPDLILWGTTIFGKPARVGKATPWHQDGDYYPIRPLETMSVWIALDNATPDNGCLRFIPGSHKAKKLFSHHWEEGRDITIKQVCDAKHFDESTARDLVLDAGQISYHDVYMIHGSHANRSGSRRAAFVIRIMPGSCHYDHALGEAMGRQNPSHDYGRRPLFQIRGRDRTGKNNFEIGHHS